MAHIKNIKKIYADGRHNAFTDMEYWKGHYYVAFRHSSGHMACDGAIRVIRSSALSTWEVCGQISTDGDDADPHLLDLGDELGLYFYSPYSNEPGQRVCEWKIDKQEYMKRIPKLDAQTYMSFTSNGTSWSSPEPVYELDFHLWQVERFRNVFYGAAFGRRKNEGALKVVYSTDGRSWETISEIPPDRFRSTEVGLWVTDDEKMHMVIRLWEGHELAFLALSEPPYKNWKLKELNYTVDSPVIRPVNNELWVAGRAITEQLPSSMIPAEPSEEQIASWRRFDERLPESQRWLEKCLKHHGSCTAIWRLVNDKLKPILVLPSGGDNAYPGMVVTKENRVLISYYSQHEVDKGPEPHTPGIKPSTIFLAEIVPQKKYCNQRV